MAVSHGPLTRLWTQLRTSVSNYSGPVSDKVAIIYLTPRRYRNGATLLRSSNDGVMGFHGGRSMSPIMRPMAFDLDIHGCRWRFDFNDNLHLLWYARRSLTTVDLLFVETVYFDELRHD
jgi:hypothetical protein